MAFNLRIFGNDAPDQQFLQWLTESKSIELSRRFSRLWDYYVNEMQYLNIHLGTSHTAGRQYTLAQETGLPARITGQPSGDIQRKEVVIENDITWRISAMVDFLFGKPVSIVSKASDPAVRKHIEMILATLFEAGGGISFFQEMAVLGSVYGFVDCLIRPAQELHDRAVAGGGHQMSLDEVLKLASATEVELIEATRALPILDEQDYRRIRHYVQHFTQAKNAVSGKASFLSRLLGNDSASARQYTTVTEITGCHAWQRYEDGDLVAEGVNPWGFIPLVHIQNTALPYSYEGQSDVEPLIPLQDELNTRLSDRANRITMQTFRMYLARCIEGVNDRVLAPGRIWSTSNPEASIQEFGGDGRSLSEDAHINEIREAMDKTSGVTPVVAGLLKSKLGNLTSAVALRMTLMGTLSRTERKKFTYGRGIAHLASRFLDMLDKSGVFHTDRRDRGLEVIFPDPLPEDTMEKLQEAKLKRELGVSQEQVLRELGYQLDADGSTTERIEV